MVRIVVSDPETGEAYQIEPDESQFDNLIGMKVGEKFAGEDIGLQGYELKITGGSDEEGFPMRSGVRGRGRARALLGRGVGYNPKREGERRRKTVRGESISDNIIQLNVKITEHGGESVEKILGLETGEEETGKQEEAGGEEESEA